MGGTITAQQGSTTPPASGGAQFTPITTPEEYNAVTARIRKQFASEYANYDSYKAAAEKLAEIEEADKTELQKAQDRADAAEAKAKKLELAQQIETWKKEVSTTTGIPANVLSGDTKEALEAHAAALKPIVQLQEAGNPTAHSASVAPIVPGLGTGGASVAATTEQQFAEAFGNLV
jgi:transcription-repair coupling factor (superfamily II helicase)